MKLNFDNIIKINNLPEPGTKIVVAMSGMVQFRNAVSDEINPLLWKHPTEHFLEGKSAASQLIALS